MSLGKRPTNEPRFKRARLPLPVYSGPRCWSLQCACGVELNTCPCSADGEKVHVEVWQGGCAFVARFYPPRGAPPTGITPRTSAQASWLTLRPALQPAPTTQKSPAQEQFIAAFPTTQAARQRQRAAPQPRPAPPARIPGRPRTSLDEDALVVRWQSGEDPQAIARDLGVSYDTLYNRMKALGIKRPSTNALTQHGDELRAMTAEGLSQAAMALRLGVSATAVCRALKALGIGGWKRGPRGRGKG